MEVHAYHGATLQQVRDAYTRQPNADDEVDEVPVELAKYRLDLQPPSTRRGRGANQLGAKTFRQRLDAEKGAQFIIAVKNTNRWDTPGEQQAYALAVTLERDERHTPLYAELRARLEAIVEVEVEVEVEIQG
jgi:hypothetical protein